MNRQEALERLQDTELQILLAIARFCEENGISWFIDGGTCLGAVRHQGFIPWDDDIDIGMLRPDYDRFCELAAKGLPEGFSLHTSRNTPGYAALFAKVYRDGTRFENRETREAGCPQGIFVDVFPYDRLPEDPDVRSRCVRVASTSQRLSYLWHSGAINVPHHGVLGAVESAGCRVAPHLVRAVRRDPSAFQDRFDAALARAEGLGDTCLTLVWPDMAPVPVEQVAHTQTAVFEGHELPVPSDVEGYLANMYGDWHTLPAESERHTHLPLLLDFGDGDVWEA